MFLDLTILVVSPKPLGEVIGGNEYLVVENRYRTGSETGNGSGQVWGHVGLRSSQEKLCAGKPFWIYRTTQSMARYSRHAAIRHAPKYWWIPTIVDYSWNFNISSPPKTFLFKFWFTRSREFEIFAKLEIYLLYLIRLLDQLINKIKIIRK